MIPDERLRAYAYLSRVIEAGSVPAWEFVSGLEPQEATARIRARQVPPLVLAATEARHATAEPERDLDAAAAVGARLVTPDSDEWPHFALGALERVARRRVAAWHGGEHVPRLGGEQLPPLALWVQGPDDLAAAATRSVAIVGSRACTAYGDHVAVELARGLAEREVTVVSGGAFGIDAAAHRGALAADGRTWVVSAAGIDRPYPTRHAPLFTRAATDGLIISEYPPGSAPHRHRFIMRNRLIAALTGGTVVVEAAGRSGALNTTTHARCLGRHVMVVPGPVTSTMSEGCHQLLRRGGDFDQAGPVLVTDAEEVMQLIDGTAPGRQAAPVYDVRAELDALDPMARQVFEGLPGRGYASEDQIARRCGMAPLDVVRSLPTLQLSGLVESSPAGYRIASSARPTSTSAANG